MSHHASFDVFAASRNAVFAAGQEGKVLFWNSAAEKLFGFTSAAMLGSPFWSAWPVAQRSPLKAEFQTLNDRQFFQFERAVPNPDGTNQPVILRLLKVDGQPPADTLFLGFCQEKLENTPAPSSFHALNQSQKAQAINALASGLAHDFNNIFTAILSHLDLILHNQELPDSMKEGVGHVQTSARRGAELVTKLLTFSRRTEPKLAPVNLASVIRKVLTTLPGSLDPRVELNFASDLPGIWPVTGDESQIMQMLTFLCLNARDAMPRGGELGIELQNISFTEAHSALERRPGDFVRLTVSDTGQGIPPEVLNRLFEPYFTTKPFGKGSGLGLSIAYNIVNGHRGWIEIESVVNQGSRFQVFLPRAASSQSNAVRNASFPQDSSEPSLEGTETILVADDEEMVRLVVRAVLSYRGYKIIEAADGAEAVAKFQSAIQPVDLVILDVDMPKLDGWKTLAQLRQLNRQTRAILFSGAPAEEESAPPDLLEGTQFLAKPFDNYDMLRLVRSTLNLPAPGARPPNPPSN
jgi:two-component system, cell cycle sensor histidine kinase and response regulator CckA